MRKNPFSLFDFLGYVFPGAFALFLIYFFYNIGEVNNLAAIINCIKTINIPFSWENTLLLTIISYVLGHFIAYFSSLTIEQFAIWLYGYPSEFLLNEVTPLHYWKIRGSLLDIWEKSNVIIFLLYIVRAYFWRITVGIIVLPLTICSIIFAKILGLKSFFIKKLDDDLIFTINVKCTELAHFLHFKISGKETDFHRVIYHYEYELQKSHALKMDNYVAIYGFLRAITFIFNSLFLYLLLFIAVPTIDTRANFNWSIIVLLLLTMGITYLFFMGYMKFNRRFTLESFMCLVIDNSYCTTKRKSTHNL